jgi:hypothetical protein
VPGNRRKVEGIGVKIEILISSNQLDSMDAFLIQGGLQCGRTNDRLDIASGRATAGFAACSSPLTSTLGVRVMHSPSADLARTFLGQHYMALRDVLKVPGEKRWPSFISRIGVTTGSSLSN